MNKKLYTILQWTWGLPQTLIGSAVFIMHRNERHFDYKGATATEWKRSDGVSLGKFIFVPERNLKGGARNHSVSGSTAKGAKRHAGDLDSSDDFMLIHEYGHTIQSAILGPAYLLLVGLPSMIWNRLPYFRKMRSRTGRSYYSVIFERTATALGRKARDRS